MINIKKYILCFAAMLMSIGMTAQNNNNKRSLDSIQHISEVHVYGHTYKEVIPAQRLSGAELQKMNTLNIADALRYFAGVQVKDYGGVGGIKTINVRSMGTNHLGVFYDDVQLGNAQNGQIDLGQFSLDNIEAISLYNGQKSNIFQSAKDFASAGAVYIRTRKPQFDGNKQYNFKANLKAGSFDVINPSLLLELKLTQHTSLSFNAEWMNASGKYKFRYKRVNPAGEVAYDTTAVRNNGDINATRMEATVYGDYERDNWNVKVYNYNSERGIPGAIVNNVWRRGERIWDTNSFIQSSWQHIFSNSIKSNLKWKYAYYKTHYVNNDDKLIKVDNLYKQKEFYLSYSTLFSLLPGWDFSAACDLEYNKLNADIYDFVFPERFTGMLSAATAFSYKGFKSEASVVGIMTHDNLVGQPAPDDQRVMSPALFLSYKPFEKINLSVRAYAKKSFRMPTFNDLYYAEMGNAKLDPETAFQYDAGLSWQLFRQSGLIRRASIQADAYYNRVRNKIVAYPKGQQFRWTMLNLGKVDIKGIDASALVTFRLPADIFLTTRLQYTYNDAVDKTCVTDTYYGDQIPYIPWNSGSAVVNLEWKQWMLNYSFIYVGERYNQQENIRYNYTQPWYTSDVSLTRMLNLGKMKAKITAEVNNLFSQDYDVILNYPMPKRNYRLTMSIEY